MTRRVDREKPAVVGRVSHDARGRGVQQACGVVGTRRFKLGDKIRSLTQVSNDGTYPHRDLGELLVRQGDAGHVREDWSFLGEVYYTVEFASRAAVVIMRAKEMERVVSS